MRNLRKQVYSKDKNQRTIARSAAAKLVQEFTIREAVRLESNCSEIRTATLSWAGILGFPDRNQKRYQLELSTADRERLTYSENIHEMVGIAFLPKNIRLSKKQRELGFKETSIIKQTLSLAKPDHGTEFGQLLHHLTLLRLSMLEERLRQEAYSTFHISKTPARTFRTKSRRLVCLNGNLIPL